jgi:hypothetical protein
MISNLMNLEPADLVQASDTRRVCHWQSWYAAEGRTLPEHPNCVMRESETSRCGMGLLQGEAKSSDWKFTRVDEVIDLI